MFTGSVESVQDNMDVMRAIQEVLETEVLVGIPEEEAGRNEDSPVSNADLLYIHTHGSPLQGIDPRPVVEPAIEDDSETISDMLGDAARQAMDGDAAGAKQTLKKIGMHGQNISRAWFENEANNWKEIDAKTAERKGNNLTLIDTQELRKSITYKVEKVE